MRKLIIHLSLIFIVSQSLGQFLNADYKKAELLKSRPLIVALFDLGEEAKTHCDSVHMAYYNEQIRKLFPQYWQLSDSIIFMRSTRVASIIASKSHEYIIFSGGPSTEGQQSSGDVFWYPSYTFMLYLSEEGKKFDVKSVDRGLYSRPMIPDAEMTGQLFRGKYIFKLSFYDMYLSEADLIFTLEQFNLKIKYALEYKIPKGGIFAKKIPKDISDKLKEMTLLISPDMDPEDSNEKAITRYYHYPFRLVSQQEINEAIIERTAGMAYIHFLWSDYQRMFMAYIIGTETGEVLATFRPGDINIDVGGCPKAGTSYRNMINMKAKRLKSVF